jgi:hypothetical protein
MRRRTVRGRPDSLARTGSNLYVTGRYSGYVVRILRSRTTRRDLLAGVLVAQRFTDWVAVPELS